jgi:flagellar motor switch protein FliN/FliY
MSLQEGTTRMQSGSTSSAGPHILGIPVTLDVVLGSTRMSVASLMKLVIGDIVPLERMIGEPVDLCVNGKVVARGEIVVVGDDSRLGVSISEIVGT